MSQLLESEQCYFGHGRSDNDDPFITDPSHVDDPPWDNTVSNPPIKENAVHFQSTHWDNRVIAQHFKPNAKFINVSAENYFYRYSILILQFNRCLIVPQTQCQQMNLSL